MRFLTLFVALLISSVVASGASFDPPKRKSGLWEIKIANSAAKGGHAMHQCIDEKTDELMKDDMKGMEKSSCSKTDMRREGDKIISESVCKVSGSTAKTRAVFTGRFDSAYQADIKSTYEPPLHGMRESSTTIDAKWLGACKPGQKPGDISMPGMPDLNMNEMMKGMGKKP